MNRVIDTRLRVRIMLDAGLTKLEIARRLGISKATVSYHAARLGFPVDEKCNRRYDWSEVQAYYDAGHSVTECREKFGFARETWNQARRRGAVRPRARAMPIMDLLVQGRRTNRTHLKQRLLSEGLKENRCEECGLTEWRGRPIAMALHHVNGDGLDNRLGNLRFLCPNCHAQTPNFSGKNSRHAWQRRLARGDLVPVDAIPMLRLPVLGEVA